MKLENIKELLKVFANADYRDLFGATILNEKIEYFQDIEDITMSDIIYLDKLYNKFMESDNLSLINQDLLDDLDDNYEEEE